MTSAHTYTLKALTDIWTGSVRLEERNGQLRERIVPYRLITTGLLGSIRWWFEVVVRGLGGCACDPTRTECQDRNHCVVCELFGCTGWARKFRFDVLDEHGQPKADQIKKSQTFKLHFTELRPICDEEWALLDLAIRLIAEYGAIGGKTVYKPTEETSRQSEQHHQDLGLVKLVPSTPVRQFQEDELRRYVSLPKWRKLKQGDFAWASLDHFWCVNGRHLARQNPNQSTFNRVIGRPEPKANASADDYDSWLAGKRARGGDNPQPPESKKVFSFKEPESARRTFGFAESRDRLNEVAGVLQEQLSKEWPGFDPKSLKKGTDILRDLIAVK
jgi:CRISPR-associated protein Cmr1